MWIKKGLIYSTTIKDDWNVSHAQVPIARLMEDRIRVYYSTRSLINQSYTSFLDLDVENLKNIIYVHSTPILKLGEPGTFDDSGIMPTSILNINEKTYLYYIGWTKKQTVPYHNSIGIAVEGLDGNFEKLYQGPILTATKDEPFFCGTGCVYMESHDSFKMWYLSCIGWISHEANLEPMYNLKYSTSSDGITWVQNGKTAIELECDEGGIASATVLSLNSIYLMWFSVRKQFDYRNNSKNSYRIKMAYSKDGINWKRSLDKRFDITISDEGWDSEMVAYPNVLLLKEKLILFYNGNGFGKTGIGYAEMDIHSLENYIKTL
jgi:hypothetical protein